jgi:hypothetical protein
VRLPTSTSVQVVWLAVPMVTTPSAPDIAESDRRADDVP